MSFNATLRKEGSLCLPKEKKGKNSEAPPNCLGKGGTEKKKRAFCWLLPWQRGFAFLERKKEKKWEGRKKGLLFYWLADKRGRGKEGVELRTDRRGPEKKGRSFEFRFRRRKKSGKTALTRVVTIKKGPRKLKVARKLPKKRGNLLLTRL